MKREIITFRPKITTWGSSDDKLILLLLGQPILVLPLSDPKRSHRRIAQVPKVWPLIVRSKLCTLLERCRCRHVVINRETNNSGHVVETNNSGRVVFLFKKN